MSTSPPPPPPDHDVDPTAEAPAPPPKRAEKPVGEQVMHILEDVERQFDRLRSAQTARKQEVATIADRTAALDRRQAELESARRELEQARASIETEQSSLVAARATLDRERDAVQARDAELEEARSSLDSARADLERRTTALRAQQQELERRQATMTAELETARTAAAGAETERAELMRRLEQAEQNVGELMRDAEKAMAQLEQRGRECAQAKQRGDDLEQQLAAQRESAGQAEAAALELANEAEQARDAARAELDTARSNLRARERELASIRAEGAAADEQITGMRADVQRLSEELERATGARDEGRRAVTELERRVASAESALAERETTIAGLRAGIEAAQATIEHQAAQLDDATAKLELAGEKLATFAEHLREQEAQLEAAAAHGLTVEQQQRQIDELTRQIAEQDVQGDPEAMRRKDDRIRELTDALRQARGQTGAAVNVGAIEQENAELREKLDALQVEHRQVQLAAQKTAERLKAQTDRIGQQKHADENARRTFEAEKQALQSRIETLEKQLAGTKRERDEARARASTAAPRSGAARDDAHLRRRRLRLRRLKTLLADRARTSPAVPSAPLPASIAEERRNLESVRDMLATTERRMIRRWAASRTMSRLGWLVILLAATAAGSWFTAGHLHPPLVAATVTIAAEPIDDGPVSDAALQVWQGWHLDQLGRDAFLDEAAERAMTRRVAGETTREALAARLAEDLRVEGPVPGEVTLTLTGTEPRQVGAVLDIVATTAAKRSERELLAGGSNLRSVVRGERREGVGRIRYAETLPLPVSDIRFERAVLYFAGGTVAVVLLITLLFGRLLRAKRLFDQENDLFAA